MLQRLKQEDSKFKAIAGSIVRPGIKKKTTKRNETTKKGRNYLTPIYKKGSKMKGSQRKEKSRSNKQAT